MNNEQQPAYAAPLNEEPQKSWFNFVKKTNNEIEDEEAMRIICEMKADPGSSGKTKAVWFSRELVEEMYEYLKANGNDGVRVYMGKYPHKDPYKEIPSRGNKKNDYRGKHTLVIIPTNKISDTESADDLVWKDCKDLEKELPADFLKAYNHGELCPPLTGCR